MRRRSGTLHATNVDDYLNAALNATLFQMHSKQVRKPSQFSRNKDLQRNSQQISESSNTNTPNNNKQKESQKESSGGASDFWNNFDFDCENTCSNNTKTQETSVIPSLTFSDNTADTDCSEESDGNWNKVSKNSLLKKIMVIGLNQSGKHSLINTIFECGQQEMKSENQIMDLLTKTEKDEEERDIRYQFWIHNLNIDEAKQNKFQDLIKMYYKNVSLFVFVYSITCRKSLECLNRAIQSVLEEVPADKFTGVLVGNMADLEEKREVSCYEGMVLQDRYKLASFMETNLTDKSLKEKFLQVLFNKEGSMEDLKAKQRDSILSTD